MDVRKIVLLVGALIVAGVTAFLARGFFVGSSTPEAEAVVAAPPVPQGPKVLVATKTLPVGTMIGPEDLRYQVWPAGLVQSEYFLEGQNNPQELIGTVVRTEVTAGQPLTKGTLVRPGDRGFLAAALGPGMRAVTVGVSATSGVAGFVFPGDRVDIVLTQQVDGTGENAGPPLRVSETIIRNIRVLATDQRLNARDEHGNNVATPIATVTLEATPRIAEKIAVAQTVGPLSLSLRSIADNNAELERAIANGEVRVPEGQDPNGEQRMLLAVQAQPIDSGSTYTVGGDVSRFQRRSIPQARPTVAPRPQIVVQAPPRTTVQVASDPNIPRGPTVRVVRGNNVTVVPVGGQ